MQDVQLYQQLLGLSGPWEVGRVTLKREAQEIEVEVRCLETVWGCPTCGKQMQGHGQEERRWRHLDSCQFKTIVVCAVPRLRCLEHGPQQVVVPWAGPRARFTHLFERLAIDVLLECSVLGACELLGISWAEADGIKQRAVVRGLARKPASAPARHLYVVFHLSCLASAKREDEPSLGLQAKGRRRGCDRSPLGLFESATQPDPSALLRPELEPLPERRLKHASSYPQE